MKFYKYEGCGNDFILTNNKNEIKNIARLCDRHYGIGADGIILVEDSNNETNIKIYNSDGSEAKTCGNGLRCVGAYLFSIYKKKKYVVNTICSKYYIKKVDDDKYDVEFNKPSSIEKEDDYYIVDNGNMHIITIENNNFEGFIKKVKSKYDANIENVKIIDKSNIIAEVYERGVGKTLACGSGAIAIVSALNKYSLVGKKVNCVMDGGILQVVIKRKNVHLIGPANKVYEGEIKNV